MSGKWLLDSIEGLGVANAMIDLNGQWKGRSAYL
jgi:hypothetical protein